MAAKRATLTAVTVGAAALLLAGGGAIAYAASSDSTPGTASTSSPSGSTSGSAGGATGKEGYRGKGGHAHTPVTGAELTKVTDAIKAKDSAVTVTGVRKDEDGSYDAFGTKAGAPVRVEVSADLKTITVETGMGRGPGGRGGHHGMAGDHGMEGQSGTGQGGVTDPRLPSSTASATN